MALDEFEIAEIVSLQVVIADSLDELAKTVDRPAPVDQCNLKEIDASSFDSELWLDAVIKLQDWMQLTCRVDENLTSNLAIRQLLEGLELEDLDSGISSADNKKLSLHGLELLAERLEKAISAKNDFLDTLEEEGREAATTKWLELWEDESGELGNEPIKAQTDVWPIRQFLDYADQGALDLAPSYQRGDVWPTKDAQMLLESILQGIPLPSIILLEPIGNPHQSFEVVDGKQRLTSILRFTGRHPAALKFVTEKDALQPEWKLLEAYSKDYPKFRKLWKKATGETLTATLEKEYYFPFKLASDSRAMQGNLKSLQGKYYTEIKDSEVSIAGTTRLVKSIFETIIDYKVPVITYTQATPSQIHQVFNLYNKQGKHLNAEEIRNAVYHDVDLLNMLFTMSADHPKFPGILEDKPWLKIPAIDISETLQTYLPSGARYKRTKLLSWLVSILLSNLKNSQGNPQLLSTARQIDDLFGDIQNSSAAHPLKSSANLIKLSESLMRTFNAHAGTTSWLDKFRNSSGSSSWQELQLVGSLLGVALAETVLGDEISDALNAHEENLKQLSKTDPWKRPAKTQTKTQWQYIARISLGILEELGVSREQVSQVLEEKYGVSPIDTLTANAHWPS